MMMMMVMMWQLAAGVRGSVQQGKRGRDRAREQGHLGRTRRPHPVLLL
jgi:hypothetical protein